MPNFEYNFCVPEAARLSLRSAKTYLWEKITATRPAFAVMPQFLGFYFCVCCRHSGRKSIDDIATTTCNDNFKETVVNADNNNFICEPLRHAREAAETPILIFGVEQGINISSQSYKTNSNTNQSIPESKETTPVSTKSLNYSQKSTASAESKCSTAKSDFTNKVLSGMEQEMLENNATYRKTSSEGQRESPTKWSTGEDVLRVEDIVYSMPDSAILSIEESTEGLLIKSASLSSLQSKSESIKTQLGDTTPMLSRQPSIKSVVIEEEIEGNDVHVMVEELEQQILEETLIVDTDSRSSKNSKKDLDNYYSRTGTPKSPSQSQSYSPTIVELKTLSRRTSKVKSMEMLYERPSSKHDLTDTTTETSSQSSSQINNSIPIKAKHSPLKKKSKAMNFLKKNRRISPVKQSIKIVQVELYPKSLPRFDKPREAITHTFDNLDSSNWEVNMTGLKAMVSLIRHHPEYLENEMHMVFIQLTRSVRNLRSQVARAACLAAVELFMLKTRLLEQECDDLACALLHRTADTNRFLRADAMRALESMCDNLYPSKILNILSTKGAVHQNAMVRTTAAKLLTRLVERLGYEKIFNMTRDNRDKVFITGANLLMEGSLETRSHAKTMFRLLSEHSNYTRLLIEIIPPRTYRNVEKTLKSIR